MISWPPEINPSSASETHVVSRGTGPDETVTKANPTTTEINSEEQRIDLKTVHKNNNENGNHLKTIAEAQKESTRSIGSMLGDMRKLCNLVAAGLCFSAAIMVKVLPEKNHLRKFAEDWAGHFARLAIGVIGGATGARDALQAGKPLLAGAQIGDALTSLIAPLKEMTNYRGLWIGAYNALPALETIHGKVAYENTSDYLRTNWDTFTSTLAKIARNPLGLLDPSKKGELGIVSGLAMSTCSVLYMITGIKAFATIRDGFGMTVEGEKIKPKHLAEGRGRYAASGYLMMAGSAANIKSKYAGKDTLFWSYLNLALNSVGKMFYLDALQANEPAIIAEPITFMEMVSRSMKNFFNFGKKTEQVLKNTQPILLKVEDQPEALRAQVRAVQLETKPSNGNSWSVPRIRSYARPLQASAGHGSTPASAATTAKITPGSPAAMAKASSTTNTSKGNKSADLMMRKLAATPSSTTARPMTTVKAITNTPKPKPAIGRIKSATPLPILKTK